jgi:hypothetical protein
MVENRNPGLNGTIAEKAAFWAPSAARRTRYAVRHTTLNTVFQNASDLEPFFVTLRLIEVNVNGGMDRGK